MIKQITDCRVCGCKDLLPLFSLGEQCVSDFAPKGKEPVRCLIDLVMCEECTLVQLRHTAPQDFMFSRFYWYRSGVTDTMRAALKDVVTCAEKYLQPGDLALDIGSNDGTLLRYYPPNITTVGVEPATNLAAEGSAGISQFIGDFWSADAYLSRTSKLANVVTACGMFYDLDNPNDFIRDVARVLVRTGVFIAQIMCLKQTLDNSDVGNFAHEHLEFYSLLSLDRLFGNWGLEIFDISENKVNGGSYRIMVGYVGQHDVQPSVAKARSAEAHLKYVNTYDRFFKQLEHNKNACVSFIKQEVAAGKTVWGYGASTKGNVILQYYGLDSTLIAGMSDRSPNKWGLYTVGSNIPIWSESEAREVQPDYFLVLPYAFLDEFVARETKWRRDGGKFLVPLPEFKIVN